VTIKRASWMDEQNAERVAHQLHRLPCLNEFLNGARGRYDAILKPTSVVGGAIKILDAGDAHHRELPLQLGKFLAAHDGLLNVGAFRHERKDIIILLLFAYTLTR